MYAITIPYDILLVCVCMYAQELMRAKGLKERPTLLSFLLLLAIAITHILTSISLLTY